MKPGINLTEAILLKSADRQAVLKDIKAAGVTQVRVEIPWTAVKSKANYADDMMTDIIAAQLEPLVMVCHPPSPLPSASAFKATMTSLVSRYPNVKAWEIWNEPNLEAFWKGGNPETFVPYLKAGYEGVKAGNPSAPVVFGGLAAAMTKVNGIALVPRFPFLVRFTNTDPVEFFRRALAAGAADYFDVLGYHPYSIDGGFRPLSFSPSNPYVVSLGGLAKLTQKGIWATEYGFKIDAFTELAQAENLRLATEYIKTKVTRQYIYSWRDNSGGNYGLLSAKNIKRYAYTWLKELQ